MVDRFEPEKTTMSAEAPGDNVRLGVPTQLQGEKIGRMILHDNAGRLYGL